mmetsp:Transcript_3549/g.6855  ORF Transcript_3549/g.6855 Transcript_3549/m.6855 type:complete len:236 (+) Transcript_3549:316-1023(+)
MQIQRPALFPLLPNQIHHSPHQQTSQSASSKVSRRAEGHNVKHFGVFANEVIGYEEGGGVVSFRFFELGGGGGVVTGSGEGGGEEGAYDAAYYAFSVVVVVWPFFFVVVGIVGGVGILLLLAVRSIAVVVVAVVAIAAAGIARVAAVDPIVSKTIAVKLFYLCSFRSMMDGEYRITAFYGIIIIIIIDLCIVVICRNNIVAGWWHIWNRCFPRARTPIVVVIDVSPTICRIFQFP